MGLLVVAIPPRSHLLLPRPTRDTRDASAVTPALPASPQNARAWKSWEVSAPALASTCRLLHRPCTPPHPQGVAARACPTSPLPASSLALPIPAPPPPLPQPVTACSSGTGERLSQMPQSRQTRAQTTASPHSKSSRVAQLRFKSRTRTPHRPSQKDLAHPSASPAMRAPRASRSPTSTKSTRTRSRSVAQAGTSSRRASPMLLPPPRPRPPSRPLRAAATAGASTASLRPRPRRSSPPDSRRPHCRARTSQALPGPTR